MRYLRRGRCVVALLVTAAAVASCTSDDSDDTTGEPTTTSTGPEIVLTRPNAPLDVKIVQIGGGVKAAKRAAITRAMSRPLETWVDGAYLDPSYPASDFSQGFDSWTPTAAKLGARDRETTTNAAIGDSSVAVVADRQQFRLFVFADHGHPGGATARVYLKLTAQRDDGSLAGVLVRGEVYLTRAGSAWRIFGYDLSRTEAKA
jgi:hypothetical protein